MKPGPRRRRWRGRGRPTPQRTCGAPAAAKRRCELLEAVCKRQPAANVIYQAAFLAGQWYGRADFLRRVEKPSALGDWSYEVVETKLARSTKARAIIQLCFYSDLVAEIQGVLPDYMHVVLGGGAQPEKFSVQPEKFSVQRYLAYFRKIRKDFQEGYAAAVCFFNIDEAVSSFRECGLAYDLRDSLCTSTVSFGLDCSSSRLQHSVRVVG